MSIKASTLAQCAVPVAVALAASTAPATADTVVPLRSILRACDFSPIPDASSSNPAAASAVIHASGGTVSADVHLAEPGLPNTHYDVALIQVPRASGAPCDGPGPGVAVAGLDTNGVGVGSTTVSGGLQAGATGAWVFIRRANPYSQSPAEFYTSDFAASV